MNAFETEGVATAVWFYTDTEVRSQHDGGYENEDAYGYRDAVAETYTGGGQSSGKWWLGCGHEKEKGGGVVSSNFCG
jgi:hypothetical protein